VEEGVRGPGTSRERLLGETDAPPGVRSGRRKRSSKRRLGATRGGRGAARRRKKFWHWDFLASQTGPNGSQSNENKKRKQPHLVTVKTSGKSRL
jgi:hypothetical protein